MIKYFWKQILLLRQSQLKYLICKQDLKSIYMCFSKIKVQSAKKIFQRKTGDFINWTLGGDAHKGNCVTDHWEYLKQQAVTESEQNTVFDKLSDIIFFLSTVQGRYEIFSISWSGKFIFLNPARPQLTITLLNDDLQVVIYFIWWRITILRMSVLMCILHQNNLINL